MSYEGPTGPTTSEWTILHDYNFNAMDGTKYEQWANVNGDEPYMFANIQTPMKVWVLFTPP